ncbi:MAG TPA: FAD-dependent thymidylate synthase [Candidatus Deferrimicrobiaceae bacterium]|jgi:thymidylate synthase (FAD)
MRASVVLLRCTPEPERLVALAARLCYSPASIAELGEQISAKDIRTFVRRVLSMGHASVLEHVVLTFGIEGISRAASHQLVRHRIASYSQQSQRYVSADFGYVTPETIGESDDGKKRKGAAGLAALFHEHMERSAALYATLVEGGIPAEDARFVLPNASETKIIVTMNARELHHFFALRLCRRAQWEIREAAMRMFELAVAQAPLLFENAGPGCVRGKCPEGEFACKQAVEVRKQFKSMRAPKEG